MSPDGSTKPSGNQNEAGKSKNKGKGKGKGKGKATPAEDSKPEPKAKAKAAAKKLAKDVNIDTVDLESLSKKEIVAVANRLRSAPKYCGDHLKGKCTKGDNCPWPHQDPYAVDQIKKAAAVRRALSADGAKKKKDDA